jgi:hypothetical protein
MVDLFFSGWTVTRPFRSAGNLSKPFKTPFKTTAPVVAQPVEVVEAEDPQEEDEEVTILDEMNIGAGGENEEVPVDISERAFSTSEMI